MYRMGERERVSGSELMKVPSWGTNADGGKEGRSTVERVGRNRLRETERNREREREVGREGGWVEGRKGK